LDEPEKFREHLESEEDAIQWRVDPVGFDKKGSTFWLFDDNRLYKETPKPKVSRKKSTAAARGNKRKRGAPAPVPPPAPPTEDAPVTRRSSRRNVPPPPAPVATNRRRTKAAPAIEEEEESEDEGEWMPWKLICLTKQDWEQISLKYANSKNLDEQRFHTLLVDELIPKIIPVLEDREKEIKKQEALMHRKRSSRIMIRELEALERASSYEEPEVAAVHSTLDHGNKARGSSRIEKRNLEKEQREQELAAKAREERALERERRIMEREYRALAREKRIEAGEEGGVEEELRSFEAFMQPANAETNLVTATMTDATVPVNANNKLTIKLSVKDKKEKKKRKTEEVDGTEEVKPKRKYQKKDKFDADGNPIPKKPRKPKLDADGNPIPLKKRGRKPKNKDLDEDNWVFDCVCGVSGQNLVSLSLSQNPLYYA
jgi:hypothetical protein